MRAVIRFAIFLAAAGVTIALCSCKDRQEPGRVSPPSPPAAVQQERMPPPSLPGTGASPSWPPLGRDEIELAQNQLQKNYYVILDCSGSMSEQQCYGEGTKMEVAQNALASFASLVPGAANLGLSIFINNEIRELVPLGQDNRETFIGAVRETYASGQTPLHSAIESGFAKLTEQARRQLGYGEYTLVVVTDGMASPGQDPTAVVHSILDRSPVEVQTIGFCIGENHPLNIPGRTVFKAANSAADLRRGLEAVLAEAPTFDAADFQGIR